VNKEKISKVYIYLTYAGLFPFLACALSLSINLRSVPFLGNIEEILGLYSLVIASFMAGSHWGRYLNLEKKSAFYLPISSNIITLGLWISHLLLHAWVLLLVYALGFSALLLVDKRLFVEGLISSEYFQTRCVASLIVVISLIISGIAL
jgi:hypothetical protein